ncbi:MAG: prepilin-type N-terminal cleavage/methylation domain-containing protein [Candidatus Sumerlaeota bacterium]|nr:prepilin-type N-terminal cleavage/methylation domain-containing protein [Candidatus Sumerlaeota bacterium]
MLRKKGFTLIELLIVVAIIAILAAIAIPNFLEAQVRSKVSRAKADIRTLAGALESYMVDWNKYPGDGAQFSWLTGNLNNYPYDAYWYVPDTVTTPMAYISSAMLVDPFRTTELVTPPNWRRYRYWYVDMTWGPAGIRLPPYPASYGFLKQWYGSWKLSSAGPDRTYGPTFYDTGSYPGTMYSQLPLPYDPTNGTRSLGDVMRSPADPAGIR